jgi:hypothetical protein
MSIPDDIWETIAAEQAKHFEAAANEGFDHMTEILEWNKAHPDATDKERETAHDQIRTKYPTVMKLHRKTTAWEAWKDENSTAMLHEKEDAFEEIWGWTPEEDDREDDPEFWEVDEP